MCVCLGQTRPDPALDAKYLPRGTGCFHQKRAGRTEREVRMCFASSRRESEWTDHTGTGLVYYCTLLSNEEVKLEQLDLVGSDTVIIP